MATPSNKNRALFLWGMAIHNAMDIYAHSVYAKIGDNMKHLDHPLGERYDNGYADKKDKFEGRYKTAVAVAKKSITTYLSGTIGKASDFYPSGVYSGAGSSWKVNKLYEYINVHDTAIAKKIAAYTY